MSMYGQSSGDFRETSGRVQLFHVVTRNTVGALTLDAFTQANPAVLTGVANATLANITKVGVLGGSVAFTRPTAAAGGDNQIGGAYGTTPGLAPGYLAGIRPLGIFINDAVGNAYENTPGPASGKGPYVTGSGSCVGVTVYETKEYTGGTDLVYAPGDLLYASMNGFITKTLLDAYEYRQNAVFNAAYYVTVVGVVRSAPDTAQNNMLVLDLRI
jgi:hypothetical protein